MNHDQDVIDFYFMCFCIRIMRETCKGSKVPHFLRQTVWNGESIYSVLENCGVVISRLASGQTRVG